MSNEEKLMADICSRAMYELLKNKQGVFVHTNNENYVVFKEDNELKVNIVPKDDFFEHGMLVEVAKEEELN